MPLKTVGYVLPNFPVLSETFVISEMRAMMRRGHRVVPLVLTWGEGARQPDTEDLAAKTRWIGEASSRQTAAALMRAIAAFRLPSALGFVRAQESLPRRSMLGASARLSALALEAGCSHLHAHFGQASAAHAIVAARLGGLTTSFTMHGHDVYFRPFDLPQKLNAADAAIAVCNDLEADVRALAPKASIVMIPCGIDERMFDLQLDRPNNGRLLFVGRLVEMKGVADILLALSELAPDQRPALDIVGDGPLRGELEALAGTLCLRDSIRFLGSRPSSWIAAEAPHYLAFIAPFKLASDGSRDAGPMVVKEAMAVGLPVITTRFMGMKETVCNDTGFVVEPGDVPMLAGAIARAAALTGEARRRLCQAARARVLERFTVDRQAASLSALIEGL
jgi:colanic acid/amylovoran biosynthesis glycosyltransferase